MLACHGRCGLEAFDGAEDLEDSGDGGHVDFFLIIFLGIDWYEADVSEV